MRGADMVPCARWLVARRPFVSYQIKCDIHTHTLFSRHAYSTIAENVAAARARGLELLGSADHFSAMLFPEPHIRNFQFFLNQTVWPRMWDGVALLRGMEADIVSLSGTLFGRDIACPRSIVDRAYKNELPLFERMVMDLDYVVASVHNGDFAREATIAQTTAMYCAVLENPHVLVLGHTGRSGIPYDLDEVLGQAKRLNKLIEINNHSLEGRGRHRKTCRTIAERCAELGVGIVVSSDAHIAPAIGDFPFAQDLLGEIHFPPELIMNRDRAALVDALAASGVADLRDVFA